MLIKKEVARMARDFYQSHLFSLGGTNYYPNSSSLIVISLPNIAKP